MECGMRWAGVLLMLVAAGNVLAETAGPVAMPEVVVTALRSETALASVPGTVRVLDRAEVRQAAPRTTPDALAGLPSVMVQKPATGRGRLSCAGSPGSAPS